MSIPAVEKVLWQAYVDPIGAERFRTDRKAFLEGFKLDEDERSLLASLDVMGLIAKGANPLLLMMAFQTANGTAALRDYFTIVNTAPAA